MPRILLADDQQDLLEALRLLFKGEGIETGVALSPDAALSELEHDDYDLVLMDLNYSRDTTSGREGLSLISRVTQIDPLLPIIVMTAWGSVEVAVEALKLGAKDFVQKPWDNDRLIRMVRTQLELRESNQKREKLEAENRSLREDRSEKDFIAESVAMRPVLEMVERIGPSDANILITGENGTGKGVIAEAIHRASERADRAINTVNAGGLAEGVFESELFGHVKGAYTDAKSDRVGRFEMSDHGTLFLDEIANVPLNLQTKLLRVLETGEFERVGSSKTRRADVRILSATNADLEAEVAAGRFRQDLYFRLNTVEIALPPLRDRPEDIPILARSFLVRFSKKYRRSIEAFTSAAEAALLNHHWPGNIRELSHAVERAVLMAKGESVELEDLGLRPGATAVPRLEDLSLDEVERYLIRRTLDRNDGNAKKAADTLGLSRSAFYRRLEKYGIKTQSSNE